MAVDEFARKKMHDALERQLGEREAATLMELLPPVGWADVATKHDLDQLERRIEARIEGMQARIEGMGGKLEGMEARIEGMGGKLEAMEERLGARMIRWSVGGNLASVMAVAAIVLGATRPG